MEDEYVKVEERLGDEEGHPAQHELRSFDHFKFS